MKSVITKVSSLILALMLVLSFGGINAFAAEKSNAPIARVVDKTELCFSNLESMRAGDYMKVNVIDQQGNPAVIGIEKVASNTGNMSKVNASSSTYKVYYTGVVINCRFYMTVSNNSVSNVYDDWIMIVGGTYDDDSLVRTSTYGKLTFEVNAYGGIMSAKCWLKGTVTGSGNEISVTYQM